MPKVFVFAGPAGIRPHGDLNRPHVVPQSGVLDVFTDQPRRRRFIRLLWCKLLAAGQEGSRVLRAGWRIRLAETSGTVPTQNPALDQCSAARSEPSSVPSARSWMQLAIKYATPPERPGGVPGTNALSMSRFFG